MTGKPMDDFLIGVSIFLLVAAAVLYMYFSYLAEKERLKELQGLAARLGLTFDAHDRFGLEDAYAHFRCIDQGHNRSASNVISGRFGETEVYVFDYTYFTTETSTNSKGTITTREQKHTISAAALDTGWAMPALLIRPEGFVDKVAGAIGFGDINFESDEFSREYHVESEDRKFAYDVIHAQMMEFLLENRGYTLELNCQSIMVSSNSRWQASQFEQALRLGDGFLEQFPHYLKEQLRTATEAGN